MYKEIVHIQIPMRETPLQVSEACCKHMVSHRCECSALNCLFLFRVGVYNDGLCVVSGILRACRTCC